MCKVQTEPSNSLSGRFSIPTVKQIGHVATNTSSAFPLLCKADFHETHADGRHLKITVVRDFMKRDGGLSC